MKECMAQADSPKEASAFERMNEWAQLLFSNISTHYFIEWRIPSGLLKKKYITWQNILCFQQILLKLDVAENCGTPKVNLIAISVVK